MGSVVVKVGGSLYDLPDLGSRLQRWLATLEGQPWLLVPGGGAAADVVRRYDAIHRLGEEAAHWLALGMLSVNARFLAALLPGAVVVPDVPVSNPRAILDPGAFAQRDEGRAGCLPHRWDATSDSFALRAAALAGARQVVLLKSIAWSGSDWSAAAAAGVVDAYFPELLRRTPTLDVRVVNLRP